MIKLFYLDVVSARPAAQRAEVMFPQNARLAAAELS